MNDRLFPLLMTQEYWMDTQLSIARYYGGAILGGGLNVYGILEGNVF